MRIISILFLLFPLLPCAQETLSHRPDAQELAAEALLLQQPSASFFAPLAGPVRTTPPGGPLRTMAEWEEIQALVITWTSFPSIQREIVRHAQKECRVIIVCSDSNAVKTSLTSAGVPLTNLTYLIAPFNSIWIRDYFAHSVYKYTTDSLFLADWKYNRSTRTKDDTVAHRVAANLSLPVYSTTVAPNRLIHTGGNFMSDGFGTGFSSELVQDENPSLTSAQVDTIMKKYMGIHTYVKMPVLPYDEIHHIDMHMKLLDERTLLVGEYPAGTADGPQIELNLQQILATSTTRWGTPWRVIRIPMPPDANGQYPDNFGDYRTYTNCVFVNKTVLVPVYQQQYDTTALRILRQSLPGYTVVGIPCNDIITSLGAIHCITHSVGENDPLLISHLPVDTFLPGSGPDIAIRAELWHTSGIDSAQVFYTTDTTLGFSPIAMQPDTGNTWVATIPVTDTLPIHYYITGTANSGKQQVRPMPAPAGFWTTRIETPAGLPFRKVGFTGLAPNPASTVAVATVQARRRTAVTLQVMDISGRIQWQETLAPGHPNSVNFRIPVDFLQPGVYVVFVSADGQQVARRLVVQP